MKESDIQKAILDYLKIVPGCFAIRTNNIGVPLQNGKFRPSPVKGLSDILVCYRGRFIAIEVKNPKGAITKHQRDFISQVINSGGMAIVARSLDDVIRLFNELTYRELRT